jgi:UDP-N-acetylmuramoyl-tripeptide--D-alanyl-D-alanine ligase
MWNSGKIAQVLGGKLYGSEEVPFQGCVLDSRQVREGEVFVAIQGEKTDGHIYIRHAFEAGAGIVLAETARLEELGLPETPENKALISVRNSTAALQALAKAWRKEIKPLVVGITGSSGKTTTKDMVAAVLAQKYRIHKSRENHNNELGLPLTILSAPRETEAMVLEMGMRGLGQIAALCEICSPSIGVITNIGNTHLELLGSQEKIAEAKWELIASLPEEGTAVLNAEDFFSIEKAKKTVIKKVFYGIEGRYVQPDVYGEKLQVSGFLKTIFEANAYTEKTKIILPLPGKHNVLDALAALAVGLSCGVSLEQASLALERFELSKMRLEIFPGVAGSIVISDVYNANPASMKASLQVLSERGGSKTIAVLGEMYELGDAAISGHREVGQLASILKISELVTVGKLAEDIARGAMQAGLPAERIHVCGNCDQAAFLTRRLLEEIGPDAWILVKGSRGMKMERVSQQLVRR